VPSSNSNTPAPSPGSGRGGASRIRIAATNMPAAAAHCESAAAEDRLPGPRRNSPGRARPVVAPRLDHRPAAAGQGRTGRIRPPRTIGGTSGRPRRECLRGAAALHYPTIDPFSRHSARLQALICLAIVARKRIKY